MHKGSRKSPSREVVRELTPRVRSIQVGSVEVEARAKLRDVLIQGGLAVATAMLEEEVERLCGPPLRQDWGRSEPVGARPRGSSARRAEGEAGAPPCQE
jgi:hypothetical protein